MENIYSSGDALPINQIPTAEFAIAKAYVMNARMSAFGPKRTSLVAPHMSAFGGKADITFAGIRFAVAIRGKADIAFCGANVR
jgi:hypothetical protein